MKIIKFPSIDQFRNSVRYVKSRAQYVGKGENGDSIYDPSRPLPTLEFQGTVKLHGTNAGIVYDGKTKEIHYQSRERILTFQQDNAGFMLSMKAVEDKVRRFFEDIVFNVGLCDIAIFGEWCGSGIQKGVGISQIPKRFVVFGIKCIAEDSTWLDLNLVKEYAALPFEVITEFPTWNCIINFAYPELIQNELVRITEEVEQECPVAKELGASGWGEGVVWKCITPGWRTSATWFKVKGEKHSVSKVKELASVDVEAVENLRNFVDSVVTENRLEQMLDVMVRENLKEFEMKSLGDFLRLVFNDILKEEEDTIVENQIDPKKMGSAISNKARPWYIQKLNESAIV